MEARVGMIVSLLHLYLLSLWIERILTEEDCLMGRRNENQKPNF